MTGLQVSVRGSGTPARGHGLDNSKHNQAEPEVDQHTEIDLEWRVMGTGWKVPLYKKVNSIACEHSYQSMEEVSG